MTIENWRFWLVPFAIWGVVMVWYGGYQSGYEEGHKTAWEMSRPNMPMTADGQLVLNQSDDEPITH